MRGSKRRPYSTIVLGLVALGAIYGISRAHDSWRFQADIDQAKAVMAANPAKARQLLMHASSLGSADGEVDLLLGVSEQALKHTEAALAAWKRVKSDSRFAPHAAILQARSVLRKDRFADAEPLLKIAIKGKGKLAIEARETLVNLYKIQGRFIEARALVSSSWGIYPDSVGLIKELEQLGSNNPKSVDAISAALQKASRNAPDDDRIWLGWANLATRLGQFVEAKKWLDACLERRPADPAVWRGIFERALAMQDEAEVERALRHLPQEAVAPYEVLSLQAWFAARAGDLDRERRAYEGILAREPGNLRALGRLADLALAAGEAGKAAQLRTLRAELTPAGYKYQNLIQKHDSENLPETARLAEKLGRVFEAHSLWSTVATRNPKNQEAREAMARLSKLDAHRPTGPPLSDLMAQLDAMPRPNRSSQPEGPGVTPDFADDAAAVGLRFQFDNGATPLHHTPETTAGGVALLDYDGDGWLDIYVTQACRFPPDLAAPKTTGDRLFRNRGDGTFEDATESSGLAAFAKGYGHGVTVGDYDNDGHPDLFVTRWRRYGLYRNRGDGTFEEATERAGLGGDRDWPTSAAFADLDGDGDLDLYVCHYLVWNAEKPNACWDDKKKRYTYCAPQFYSALPDHLFRNDNGRFIDVTAEAGIVDRDGRGLGVVAADLDGDGRVDLYVANDQTANYLWRNKGAMKFEEVAETSAVACNASGIYQASMGIACGDSNGDGLPDLAVTAFFNEYTALYHNCGSGIFRDATAEAGLSVPTRYRLGFGISFLDANNDGKLDLATANGHVDDFRPEVPFQMPAQLLLGTPAGKFVDATEVAGAPWMVPRVARGLAVGDLDNDGRTDLVIISHDTPLAYFHNRTNGGHWVDLTLEGTTSNRDAVGAKVVVSSGNRRWTAWRIGGGSFQSASDPRLHFGIGGVERVDQVEVTWPSGRVDRFGPLVIDTAYRLHEGSAKPSTLPRHRDGALVNACDRAQTGTVRRQSILSALPGQHE